MLSRCFHICFLFCVYNTHTHTHTHMCKHINTNIFLITSNIFNINCYQCEVLLFYSNIVIFCQWNRHNKLYFISVYIIKSVFATKFQEKYQVARIMGSSLENTDDLGSGNGRKKRYPCLLFPVYTLQPSQRHKQSVLHSNILLNVLTQLYITNVHVQILKGPDLGCI